MRIDTSRIKAIDNELTYAITYRNMYNYGVIVLGLWYLFITPVSEIQQAVGIVLLTFGFKWLLWQIRENIDTIDINKQLISTGSDKQ